MKTVLKLITLLLLALTFQIPSSFGQDNIVKVIYFYPNDRTPQADIDATLDTKLKNAQAFFAAVLELYGYERKTFEVETDGDEKVVVHHVQGIFNDAYYHDDPFSKIINELYNRFSSSENIYYVAIDIDSEVLEVEFRGTDVQACGIASGNWGATPAQGNCFSYNVIAHELGHTFGLDHDAFSSGNIDPMINSPCSAAWLDVHPYFNGGNTDSGPTTIQMLPPQLAPEEGKVRFSFEVSDPDGLHLIRLFIHEQDTVVACKPIGEVDSIIHIDTSYIPQVDPSAELTIMDKSGNYTSFSFDVNTADLLNSIENVAIPDANLAAIIREHTNLAAGAQITTQSLSRLLSLELTKPNLPITDLTGLEQALNLETLLIQNQQTITDFSQLRVLTKLSNLEISNCGISDLSILSTLTNLRHLNLSDNAIQNISVLSGLTNLRTLDLSNNQINDVNPLATLNNLEQLRIIGNPIADITPLLTLQEQNPNLELTYDDIPDETVPDNIIDNVAIPDANLAAIIREHTNLASGVQITTQVLSRLISLELTKPNLPITDLTGLEQALNLETLLIQNQQTITDLSQLRVLTKLSNLEISNCGISDLSILSTLTNLRHLNLSDNAIQNISVLSGLTNLRTLDLSNNQINDVNPLATLNNLEQLRIIGNPIADITPLLTLQEQNPNLELTYDDIPDETVSNNIPTFTDGESAIRWVLEKIPIGTYIGRAITAYDIDNDTITYSISGYNDSDVITIDTNTGQLKTNAILDYNTQNIYIIDVTASNDRGGSATITVTIHVAPAGGGNLIPELIPIRVSFSELMIYSDGGLHSLSQWMELYNGSQTEVNLKGWQLAIEARDLNGVHRHAIIALEDLYIPPKETALIVTWLARQKSNIILESRVYNFFDHHSQEFEQNQHRNMVIGLAGFSLKLTNTDGILVDSVGNLDGDHSTTDKPTWVIPIGTTKDGQRTSLMRRFEKETQEPLDGTDVNNWQRTADFPLDVSTYWGIARDIGNPGFRGSGALPVTLSQFRAELTQKGTVLTWTTESELENAGFYILRSETQNGPFKVVSPTMIQGAGTTGERNKYTWTDNTIKHDTRYYYRIVDVSFAGVKQKLATVGLRGLLSARNKELKRWADLKVPTIP